MVDRLIKYEAVRSPLLLTLLASFVPAIGSAALPPPKAITADKIESAPQGAPGAVVLTRQPQGYWVLPSMRLGGSLSYSVRRDMSDGQAQGGQSQGASLGAKFNGFLWQPWAAQYTCDARVTVARDQNESNGQSSTGQNVSMTGTGQLSLLPKSAYPFEAHFSRFNGRFSNDLALSQSYAGQSFGFSQAYSNQLIHLQGGWDRNLQNGGRDQQDRAHLNASGRLLHVTGSIARNSHDDQDGTTQNTQQNNISASQSLDPAEAITLQNMLSLSQSSYRLQRAEGSTNVAQLSSVAFWRPEEMDVTVSGGARILMLNSESLFRSDIASTRAARRSSSANFNVGMNYDGIEFVRINAGGNLNLSQGDGVSSSDSSQNIGIAYQPDSFDLGGFQYGWTTSASANRSSGEQVSGDLALSFGHYLGRTTTLTPRTSISMNANQSISASAKSGGRQQTGGAANDGVRKYLTHGASLGGSLAGESASASAYLSASDGRSISGNGEFFQSINFQASSNMPSSKTASWSGNFTIQASRQGGADARAFGAAVQNSRDAGFVTNSSGSVSYQQQRLFGIRRLRLVSDFRVSGQALLPLLGGPQDQELSAWDSRFDYVVGRTQFRLNFLLSRTVTPAVSVDPATGAGIGSSRAQLSKSVSFSMSRTIGDM